MFGVSILPDVFGDTDVTLINTCMAYVCSYFDGEAPEEDKHKIKSEDEEEDINAVQKKATHKSQR